MPETGLTPLILGALKASDADLAKARANVANVAARHGISVEVARYYMGSGVGR